MFNINWAYTCYECQCPLSIKLSIYDKNIKLFMRDFTTWCYLNPFCLVRNMPYYKSFGGLKMRRVCLTCYYCPKRPQIYKREVGTRHIINPCKVSTTKQKLLDYFTSFVEFRKRKDLEICIVEEYKRTTILGLNTVWRP